MALDLKKVTLVCQDWGGPIGLAQAASMPDRFDRLVIMNTWLHHDGYSYCDNVKNWVGAWKDKGFFCHKNPDVALIPLMDGGFITRKQLYESIALGINIDLSEDLQQMYDGYNCSNQKPT